MAIFGQRQTQNGNGRDIFDEKRTCKSMSSYKQGIPLRACCFLARVGQ